MAIDLYKNRCSVYEGDKPYIFVSYSHRDIEKVVALIRKLQSLNFRVWYDSGIPAGAEWPEEIAVHLKNSGCVLSLLSANSVKSRHFKEEFNYANHLDKDILVVYLEDCELTPGMEMRVVSQQCIMRGHCEDDNDLLEEIARAAILRPCVDIPSDEAEAPAAIPAPPSDAPEAELDQLRKQAESGDAQAQFELGMACYQAQNYTEAAEWYLKAGKQGHAQAQYHRGLCYEYRHGLLKNYIKAGEWYRRAADQGYAPAQNKLGYLYLSGRGVDKDLDKAIELFRKAAAQGDPDGKYNLAVRYELGEGVTQDLQKALSMYRELAEQDHPYAQQSLGKAYEFSIGTEQDWPTAVYWYTKAAEHGLSFSQNKLAYCCRKGLGTPVDKAEADRWQKLYDENPRK